MVLFIIGDFFNVLEGSLRREIVLIILESKIIHKFVCNLCLDVSKGISCIIIFKYSGRSWVVRVLLGGEKVAIVNVETIDFSEIVSTCHEVLSASCDVLQLIIVK